MTSPLDATRAELRAVLYDLADALLASTNGRHVLLDGIRHAWILADLAEAEEGPVRFVLRTLARDLEQRPGAVDRVGAAQQLTNAADGLHP